MGCFGLTFILQNNSDQGPSEAGVSNPNGASDTHPLLCGEIPRSYEDWEKIRKDASRPLPRKTPEEEDIAEAEADDEDEDEADLAGSPPAQGRRKLIRKWKGKPMSKGKEKKRRQRDEDEGKRKRTDRQNMINVCSFYISVLYLLLMSPATFRTEIASSWLDILAAMSYRTPYTTCTQTRTTPCYMRPKVLATREFQ